MDNVSDYFGNGEILICLVFAEQTEHLISKRKRCFEFSAHLMLVAQEVI